ncbi:MAG: DUF2232 domain-containing protein [Gemmatimonadaceae bacterium]
MTSPARATPEQVAAQTNPPRAVRERGWRGVLAAFFALAILPTIPQLRLLVPIDQILLLIAPAMAACAVAAWWRGGRSTFALVWIVLATWILAGPIRAGGSFATMERAWCILLAGSFGLTHVVMPRHRFLQRALAAIAATTMVSVVILTLSGGFEQVHATVVTEIDRRLTASIDMVAEAMRTSQWQRLAQSSPAFARLAEDSAQQLQQFGNVARNIYVAVLAIESLAALAVTWALFHRVSRARIGAPLAALREFRFSDQLVWGLVASIVLLVLPSLSPLRNVGLNLLIFFGVLYALRGLGVLAWYFAARRVGFALIMVVAVLALPLTSLFSLGVGLGDTWLDWRARPRPATRPPSPPGNS